MDTTIFERYESEVRTYSRSFPVVFDYAKGSVLRSTDGREYLDFFCGAGALNYGHNNDFIKQRLISYLTDDRIIHGLDMFTVAKEEFISFFEKSVIEPRNLAYKVQFTGPTGTNAVEAGLKLARKYTGRANVFALNGCFHGSTLGSLALTSERRKRAAAGVPLDNVTHCPAPYQFGEAHALDFMEKALTDDHAGIDKPAAIVLETVQAEGGINVFSADFLRGVREICTRHEVLMMVDDIQVGCLRTGTFFSFERAGIAPDIVILSKSIGGFGLPFSMVLLKPDIDIWEPGEHDGTFRGNQLAMVAGKAALELVADGHIAEGVRVREALVRDYLTEQLAVLHEGAEVRGIGLIWGLDLHDGALAGSITRECFNRGLIIERAGREDSVVKVMPSLVIPIEQLQTGLDILRDAAKAVLETTG
ncbi:MAG: aspartate aminotransferase family protein [Coriobacteriales bacterium]|nr:aspartate aminotransferase family protein [Coriobacteriales bacterium]